MSRLFVAGLSHRTAPVELRESVDFARDGVERAVTALAAAGDLHATGPVTNRLFHFAFAAGKRVRAETGLGEGAVSVSYAAIALARKIFGDLTGLNVLILGAGEMAKLTAVHLQAQRVKQLTIASRTLSAAE